MRITVRILSDIAIDGEHLAPDDLVDLPGPVASSLCLDGIADGSAAAVAHAANELGRPVRVLRPEDSVAAVDAEKAPKTARRKKAAE